MSATFQEILAHFLRPFARLCLRRGLKIQEFTEAAKQAFIYSARRELLEKGQEPNISKLAIMSGLQRRDVMRLEKSSETPNYALNLLTRIIGQWTSDKKFLVNGKAKNLKCEGAESEFAQLVETVTQDINHYTILFELERIGAIKKNLDGTVTLLRYAFKPSKDSDEGLILLASDVDDLVCAVDENISQDRLEPNLHITTRYDNVSESALEEINNWMLEQGAQLHAKAREFIGSFDKDTNSKAKGDKFGATVSFGSFSRIINSTKIKSTNNFKGRKKS